MERYIEFFNGYRHAYGVADFNHQDSYIDSATGKKKPVYRWNFEELTDEIYKQHIEGKLSIGIQPCTENALVKFGVCLLYTSPSPRDRTRSRMPSSA